MTIKETFCSYKNRYCACTQISTSSFCCPWIAFEQNFTSVKVIFSDFPILSGFSQQLPNINATLEKMLYSRDEKAGKVEWLAISMLYRIWTVKLLEDWATASATSNLCMYLCPYRRSEGVSLGAFLRIQINRHYTVVWKYSCNVRKRKYAILDKKTTFTPLLWASLICDKYEIPFVYFLFHLKHVYIIEMKSVYIFCHVKPIDLALYKIIYQVSSELSTSCTIYKVTVNKTW